jgi:hypothetical protein
VVGLEKIKVINIWDVLGKDNDFHPHPNLPHPTLIYCRLNDESLLIHLKRSLKFNAKSTLKEDGGFIIDKCVHKTLAKIVVYLLYLVANAF